jgi:hypothetical protein
MSERIERSLFLHAWTDKAILVSRTAMPAEAETIGAWLPRSQIEITAQREAFHPRFGEAAHIGLIWGTVVTFTAPGWLLKSRGLTEDAPVREQDFICPQCAHGVPRNRSCPDCARERQERSEAKS